jgi:4-amino-4-deoxy-L-arabinose transferase-like glycosyltransferase
MPVQMPRSWWFRVTVLVGVAAGIVLRIWILRWPTGALDSDEAIVGLMARHIVHQHELTTFYWGQNYGGSLGAIVNAGVFAIFGSSTATLKTVPIVMSAITALLVWRLGRRTIREPGATIAGLAVWVWPTTYVWFSTKERAFYLMCMILGLWFLITVLRLVEDPDQRRDWVVLGLVGGVGWWTSPQIIYFVVPGLLWIAFKLGREKIRFDLPIISVVVGALPWFVWSFRNHWAALQPASRISDKGYLGNIAVLFRKGLPVALGLHDIERWTVPVAFPIVYVTILVAAAIALFRRSPRPEFLLVVAATFPLLWGVFPVSGYVGDGRYVMFVLPTIVLLVMYAARRPVVQVVVLVGALALSVGGMTRIRCCVAPQAPDVSMPRRTGPLIDALDAHHVSHFNGDYWIAYRVSFETNERIVGSPAAFKRYAPFERAVAADPNPPAVFVTRSKTGPIYRRGLARLDVGFERYVAGDFVVYQPARKVDFAAVMKAGEK